MGELLSMGIPVVTNAGVGDVDKIIEEMKCGISISAFTAEAYDKAVADLMENNAFYKTNTVNAATRHFSLKEGIEKYEKIYKH